MESIWKGEEKRGWRLGEPSVYNIQLDQSNLLIGNISHVPLYGDSLLYALVLNIMLAKASQE